MPARLHHERIHKSDVAPARWMILTHGIYGTGGNWRGIARKVTANRNEWGIVLVDLRLHGRSEAGEPPHTVAACAADLRALIDTLDTEGTRVDVVAGHSFGGKVAMATRAIAAADRPLEQTWILDASPSARDGAMADPSNTVVAVLAMMERLEKGWARRDDFVAAIVAEGQSLGLAQWLAMNLVPGEGGALELRLDLAALRELLADYYVHDAWGAIEAAGGAVEIVIAERSPTLDAADRERLSRAPSHVRVHHIDSGHWLHMEAPDAVVALFTERLP